MHRFLSSASTPIKKSASQQLTLGGSAIKKASTGYTGKSDHDLFMDKYMTDAENIAAYCTPGPKPKKGKLQQAAYVQWNKIKPNGFTVDGEGTKTKTGIKDRSAIIAYFAEQPAAPISVAATRDSFFSIKQSPASIARASKAGGPLFSPPPQFKLPACKHPR
jgi:hypothetical protein